MSQPTCPFDVTGFSLASVPGVVIGQNASIAWGLTTSYVDVQDLYLEEVRGRHAYGSVTRIVPLHGAHRGDPGRAGRTQPRTITDPVLPARSAAVRRQHRSAGPGRAAAAGTATGAYAVALSWIGLDSGPHHGRAAAASIRRSNFTQFRAAAALLGAPSQNLVYADTEGNIGYQLPGAMPERGTRGRATPSPGWDAGYDWRGH